MIEKSSEEVMKRMRELVRKQQFPETKYIKLLPTRRIILRKLDGKRWRVEGWYDPTGRHSLLV